MIYDIAPVNNYAGNNSTTIFEFDFYIDNEEQLKVTLFDKENIQHTLQNGVDYSINEIKNKNGSYITFPINSSNYDILSENEKISLELTLPISQETQYNNSSLLNLEALEYSFDYLTRLIQILSRKLELTIKVSEFSDQTPEELFNQLNSSALLVTNIASDINEKYNELKDISQNIDDNYEKFNQIDVNTSAITSIQNNLENKLDKNLTNITSTTKELIGSYSFPSSKFDNLTVDGNGATYTAPADGWYCFRTLNGGLALINQTKNIQSELQSSAGSYVTTYLPAAKGLNLSMQKEQTMTNYYIEQDNKIIRFDTSLEQFNLMLKHRPELKGLEIKETERPIALSNDGTYFVFADTKEYQQEQAQKEAERIAMLNLTAADVERAIYKAKGLDFDDIVALIEAQPLTEDGTGQINIKALKIELKANNFYRGNPYINQVGGLLGFTSQQLDEFFETNDYTKLI